MDREISGVDPSQVVAGEQAEDHADQQRRADHHEGEQQRRAGAVHELGEHVAPERVGAERVRFAEALRMDLRLRDQAALRVGVGEHPGEGDDEHEEGEDHGGGDGVGAPAQAAPGIGGQRSRTGDVADRASSPPALVASLIASPGAAPPNPIGARLAGARAVA